MQRSASSTSLWAPTWVIITHVTTHRLHQLLVFLPVMKRHLCSMHAEGPMCMAFLRTHAEGLGGT